MSRLVGEGDPNKTQQLLSRYMLCLSLYDWTPFDRLAPQTIHLVRSWDELVEVSVDQSRKVVACPLVSSVNTAKPPCVVCLTITMLVVVIINIA